ncbi:hypothetical protein ERJ75_000120100 [Trypanosoma vivax]|nr:hypothetical protein ERJ75_000120100 [Trypanosoma vivax]
MAEGAVGGFGQQAAAPGNAPSALKPLKAYPNGIAIIKATDRNPCLVALASEANRVAKRMWTAPAWVQRMPIMRRFGEFTKKHGPEMSEGHVQLFVASLELVKDSATRCLGHWAAISNSSAKLASLMWRTRGPWLNRLSHF